MTLAQREAAHVAVVGGERALRNIGCENRLVVAVVTTSPVSASGAGEVPDPGVPFRRAGVEVEHVVVVEVDPVGAKLGELADGTVGIASAAGRRAEHVDPLPAHRPDAKGEFVG